MRSSKATSYLNGAIAILSLVLVALFMLSWIVSIYSDGVNGLLTPRGVRWVVSSVMGNFASTPLAEIISGMIAFGVLRDSKILSLLSSKPTLKQRYALKITAFAAVAILLLMSLTLVLPNALLLSSFGTVVNSPFMKGLYAIALAFIIFVGNIYGYTSGRYISLSDFVQAHVSVFKISSPYFILLFLSSQLVNCLDYTDLLVLVGDENMLLFLCKCVLYYMPLLLFVL